MSNHTDGTLEQSFSLAQERPAYSGRSFLDTPSVCEGCEGAKPRWDGDTFTTWCEYAHQNGNRPTVCLLKEEQRNEIEDRMDLFQSMHM